MELQIPPIFLRKLSVMFPKLPFCKGQAKRAVYPNGRLVPSSLTGGSHCGQKRVKIETLWDRLLIVESAVRKGISPVGWAVLSPSASPPLPKIVAQISPLLAHSGPFPNSPDDSLSQAHLIGLPVPCLANGRPVPSPPDRPACPMLGQWAACPKPT